MKFYVIEITTYVDGSKDSYGIYPFEDKTLALASYHQKMSSAMKNENYKTEQILIVNSANGIEAIDMFDREKAE